MPEDYIVDTEYVDLFAPTGEMVRVYYELTVGDMLIASLMLLLLLYLILNTLIKMIWRR